MIGHTTKRFISLIFLLLVTVTAGTCCKKDIQSTYRGTYRENLAKHRKRLKAAKLAVKEIGQINHKKKSTHTAPTHAITDQLDYLLARKKVANEQIKHIQGYTIQAYAGGSRDVAFKIKNKLYTHYPAIEPEVTYDLPHYTVRIGKFLDKLEAYPAYAVIRKWIPQAIIRPISFVNKPHAFVNKPHAFVNKPHAFVNKPHACINKQAPGQSNPAPPEPTPGEHLQNGQE